MTSLDVYCGSDLAGTLERTEGTLGFSYAESWREAGRPPLSQSLPVSGEASADTVRAFFAGLLPDGVPRRLLARRLGVSEGNDFALLEAVGGDCPGAISLLTPGSEPPVDGHGEDVKWLDDAELVELIRTIPERPMLVGEDGRIRLSLAGAQDKLPVVVGDDGRVGITSGITPSTHILKTPITRLAGTVVNEAFCLALGAKLGVPTVSAQPRRAVDAECLLVSRYDRLKLDGMTRRLHQEDFCQALGVAPEGKYEADGGPTLADCFGLVRHATTVAAPAMLLLLQAVGLSFLVGNHDAHGKNFSLLYGPELVGVAPLYDIVSTVAYAGLSRKMAMKIGGEYRPNYVRSRHLDRMVDAAGLGPALARRELRRLADDAPSAARAVRAELAADGWDDPVLDTVLEIVDRRAAWLTEIAAPRSAAGEARAARG